MSSDNSFKRKEKKYVCNHQQIDELIKKLDNNIRPDDFYPISTISSTYWDTEDRELIKKSLEKPYFKEKIRVRSYGNNDIAYVELKRKCGDTVYKRRVAMEPQASLYWLSDKKSFEEAWQPHDDYIKPTKVDIQIAKEIQEFKKQHDKIFPSMLIVAKRRSFTTDIGIRLTIDDEILYQDLRDGDGGFRRLVDGAVLEIKSQGAYPLWLAEALTECGIKPCSFSKYGNAYKAVMEGFSEMIPTAMGLKMSRDREIYDTKILKPTIETKETEDDILLGGEQLLGFATKNKSKLKQNEKAIAC